MECDQACKTKHSNNSHKYTYISFSTYGILFASKIILNINVKTLFSAHSMEEAEFLCDRLGIFVDGGLQCIGNSKELKSRYGGSYVFTMTTSSNHEEEVERLVESISPNAKKIYHLAGTQKFELPKQEVRIAEVFRAVEKAKSSFTVFAWGLADTTLEDVFIKVARTAQAFISLS